MTFFEQELRKTVGAAYPDARYIGRAAYVDLGADNRARFEFVTLGYADHYEAIKASIINRGDGVVDSVLLRFTDLFSPKKLPLDKTPCAWTYKGETEWYGFKPSRSDYDSLTAAIRDYTELFGMRPSEPEQDMSMTM